MSRWFCETWESAPETWATRSGATSRGLLLGGYLLSVFFLVLSGLGDGTGLYVWLL